MNNSLQIIPIVLSLPTFHFAYILPTFYCVSAKCGWKIFHATEQYSSKHLFIMNNGCSFHVLSSHFRIFHTFRSHFTLSLLHFSPVTLAVSHFNIHPIFLLPSLPIYFLLMLCDFILSTSPSFALAKVPFCMIVPLFWYHDAL